MAGFSDELPPGVSYFILAEHEGLSSRALCCVVDAVNEVTSFGSHSGSEKFADICKSIASKYAMSYYMSPKQIRMLLRFVNTMGEALREEVQRIVETETRGTKWEALVAAAFDEVKS